jgi:L-seryl-tRNA(Ser) seleniumtransferase
LLTRPLGEIRTLAERLCPAVQAYAGGRARVEVAECASQVGSGSQPVDRLASAALRISSSSTKPAAIAKALRALPIPVIGRIHDDAVCLDLRCQEDEEPFASQFAGRKL